jgi:hypothetical protein
MGTFLRESRTVVKRARPWVIRVAKPRCHVVRTMAVAVVSFYVIAVVGVPREERSAYGI